MQSRTSRALLAAVAALFAADAQAGSFALKERSARAQGLSFAGVTAGSGGLASMSFNPAALGRVEDLELSGGLALVAPRGDGTVLNGPFAGTQIDAAFIAPVANGYVGYRMDREFLVGLALYSPFGLATHYDAGDIVQADTLTSKLQTLVVAPTFAWQPMPELTFAGAMNITYVNARLTNNTQVLSGSTFELSFGAGAMWEATSSTTIGVAYQHGYNIDIGGTLESGPFAALATASASLPSTVSFGVVQDITDDFRVMGEIQWQNWSVFDTIDASAPALGVNVVDPQNYDNAFFLAGGAEYDVLDELTVRFGVAWDQTPTNDNILPGTPPALGITNRTARVPDEDRLWLSVGFSYDLNDNMTLDAGYSYLRGLQDARVGLRAAPATGTQITFQGGAHIFVIGGSMKF